MLADRSSNLYNAVCKIWRLLGIAFCNNRFVNPNPMLVDKGNS